MHVFTLPVPRRHFLILTGAFVGAQLCPALFSETTRVVPQPYFAGVSRVIEALSKIGAPVTVTDAQRVTALARQGDAAAVDAAEEILNPYTLIRIRVDADGYARSSMGGAERTLVEQGYDCF